MCDEGGRESEHRVWTSWEKPGGVSMWQWWRVQAGGGGGCDDNRCESVLFSTTEERRGRSKRTPA